MNKISTVYYLGKGEVRSSILRCSTMRTPIHQAIFDPRALLNSAERGKNRQVATGENPWKDVLGMSPEMSAAADAALLRQKAFARLSPEEQLRGMADFLMYGGIGDDR